MLETVLLEPLDHIIERSLNNNRQDTPIEA